MACLLRSEQEKFARYDSRECQEEIARQLDFIWHEAEQAGLILDYQGLNDWASPFEDEAGAEHVAVLIPEESRVFKRTIGSLKGELFGVEKLPIPYLLNQALISSFFGTDTLFEGISRRPDEGTSEFLISQRFIKAADPENPYPTDSQLEKFFSREGFQLREGSDGDSIFINDDLGLGVIDSHPGNFIVNAEGIKPFDIHFEILSEESVAAISEILRYPGAGNIS